MSSVLPVIIDTPIPEITEDTEVFDLEDLNENNLNMEINDNEESEEEIIPEVKERVKIDNQVIFQDAPSVKPVAKKKRVMSEAKLKQLADAREKANATRTANKEAKLKAKREIQEATQQMIVQKQEEYVEKKVSKIKKQIDKEPVIIQKNSVSPEDIQNIVSGAISKYDSQRIARKEEKRLKKEEADKHKKINATIKKAQGHSLTPEENGYFDSCFG